VLDVGERIHTELTVSILGSATRGAWASGFLAQRVNTASAAIVPRKSLTLSATRDKRHYGPG